MSTITYLTSLVQQAIQRLNFIEANAKKVDELPHQTTLEPTSKIPVSRAGNSEHLTVQQIISSIQNSNYNQLLAVGTITVDGTDIIIPSGVSGQINGALYGTSTDTTIPITLCPAGFNRKDILVLTTSNTVIAISGEETDGAIVLAPPTPLDAIYITEFDVNDTVIGTPGDPIVGTQFKKKSESAAYNDPTLTGSDAVIQFQPNGEGVYAFSNAGLVSIDGFGFDLITGSPSAEVPYSGKDILIYNNKAGNLTLKHDGSGTAYVKFYFIDETDLIIPAGGKVWLKYGPSYCEMIFKSWVDLSTKADLVGGKVPASQLPSYVDDVLEFADLAAFPITGETGKIYLALDTNKTYRWSGSAYVQIGGTTKKTEKLFFQDAIGPTVKTITADQKNMHQSRLLANASPYGVLGLSLGTGITEVGGVVNLSSFSDCAVAQITGDYIGKVKKIVFAYARNVNESSANTNVMIRVMAETKYNTDMQLIAQHNLVSTTIIGTTENKVEIPVLTHLPLSAFSNIKWCIRSNNATAQQFGIIRLNVIVEEI